MRLHARMRIACLMLCLLGPGSAGAQSQAPSPEAISAARELLVAARMADNFKTLMPGIMRNLKPAIVQNRPQVERDYDALAPLMLEGMQARLNETTDQVAVLYARTFTTEELREVIAFYRTPTGQKFVERLPLIAQESMLIGQRFGQSVAIEIRDRMIEELRKRGHNI